MKITVIACRTIEDEINAALERMTGHPPILWVDSGLHNFPSRLRDKIQEQVRAVTDAGSILLLFGYCGGGLEGLKSESSWLVVPRVDDCISLLLGGSEIRADLEREARYYYLTDGWLRYENNIYREYQHCVRKYGHEKAKHILKSMLANYSALSFIDTGTYDPGKLMEKMACFAGALNLGQKTVPGSLRLLEKALKGKWDRDFVRVPPGRALRLEDFLHASGPSNQFGAV